MKIKIIKASSLTNECWTVQVWGIERCSTCRSFNTPGCGGQKILEAQGRKRYLEAKVKLRREFEEKKRVLLKLLFAGTNEKGIPIGQTGLEEQNEQTTRS